MSTPLLELLDRCLEYAGDVVSGIRDEQRDAKTPCTEFTVERVTAHLVNGLDWYGQLPEEGPTDPREIPERDLTGVSLSKAYYGATRVIYRTWRPDLLTTVYPMPWGDTTGAVITEFTVVEALCHGWDLAVATGQPLRPPADAAESALELARGFDESMLRAPGMMAAAVPVSPDAPAIDRLVGLLGRSPAEWATAR